MMLRRFSAIFLTSVILSPCLAAGPEPSPEPLAENARNGADAADEPSDDANSDDSATSDDAPKSLTNTAHLVSGKLGESPGDTPDEKRVWPHKLPVLGQKVVDLGFDLPNPYGISPLIVVMEQDVVLSDLRVKAGGSSSDPQAVPFVAIGTSNAETLTAEAKFDFWLFPFLNLFFFAGHINGEAFIPIEVPGEATLKAILPPLGALCDAPPATPGRPALCDQDIVILDNTSYDGVNVGGGLTFAAGFKDWFVAIPISYSESNLSNTTDFVHSFQASLRMGWHVPYRKTGMFAIYAGATYLDTAQDISGTVSSGAFSVDYVIHQEAANPWNAVVGFNWTITPRWAFQAEVGFMGARKNLITSMSYRW
jgi:hypothetical protein